MPADTLPNIHWRRAVSLLIGVLCGLLVASCNEGDSDSRSNASKVQTGAASPQAEAARAAVLRLWFEIGAGSPTLTSAYDPKLVRLLGTDLILTVFDLTPPEYTAPLKVKEIRRVPSGVVVQGEGQGPDQSEPVPVSFLVAKAEGRWLVRYDSNLLNRVRGQVAAEVRLGLPRTEEAEEQARAAGNQAVLDARTLFAEGPRKGTLPPR
jgi:hypothetical protein